MCHLSYHYVFREIKIIKFFKALFIGFKVQKLFSTPLNTTQPNSIRVFIDVHTLIQKFNV